MDGIQAGRSTFHAVLLPVYQRDAEGEDFSQENEGELLLEDGGKRSEMAETEPAGKDEKEPLDRRRTLFKATTCVHVSNSSSWTGV